MRPKPTHTSCQRPFVTGWPPRRGPLWATVQVAGPCRLMSRPLREPDDRWTPELEVVAQSQQSIEHGLQPQGGVRAALGLRARRQDSSLLRKLARLTQVAAPETLREVCRDDRPTLGRHRGLMPAGEQGGFGNSRGREQQDLCHSAGELRRTGRGVLAPESPHMHARPDIEKRKIGSARWKRNE